MILATGYKTGLEHIIEGFETIADSHGKPQKMGAETNISGLYFVGFQNSPTGALREIGFEAQHVAARIRQSS